MGLDIGDRTIGVAVSDPSGVLAQGVGVIRRARLGQDLQAVATLAREREVGLIVAGLPQTLKGEVGIQAEKVQGFVSALRAACPTPVEYWDERLTTRVAERALIAADVSRRRRRRVIDQVAAAVLLQGFLDMRRNAGSAGHVRERAGNGQTP
jgi:putative Holliday junction resolvase